MCGCAGVSKCSSFECCLERFRFDESDKTVPGHEEVDALLCILEHRLGRLAFTVFYVFTGLVINIDLQGEKERDHKYHACSHTQKYQKFS